MNNLIKLKYVVQSGQIKPCVIYFTSQFHSLNQHHHNTHTEKIFQILTNTKGGTAGKRPDLAVYRLKLGQRLRLKFGQMFHFV